MRGQEALLLLLGVGAVSAASLGGVGLPGPRGKGLAFAHPPSIAPFRAGQAAGCSARGRGVRLGEAAIATETGFGGGSIGGRGSGGGWGGRWDGQGGGGQHNGRFHGLAYVQNPNSGPRLTNRTVLEDETGIKFPPALLLDPKDKKTVRFLGAGCAKSRGWKSLFRQTKDYAVGLYIDADLAYKLFRKQMTSPEQAQEALLSSHTGVTKTLRIVLAKECDSYLFTTNINDRIEDAFAANDFDQIMWLDMWRYWVVDQGGYHQMLPKGTEIRFTWKYDEWNENDCLITEFRKRDRILAQKKLYGGALPRHVFSAYLGDKPVSAAAKDDIINRMMKLCR